MRLCSLSETAMTRAGHAAGLVSGPRRCSPHHGGAHAGERQGGKAHHAQAQAVKGPTVPVPCAARGTSGQNLLTLRVWWCVRYTETRLGEQSPDEARGRVLQLAPF